MAEERVLLGGSLSMSVVHGGDGRRWRIALQDESSRVQVVEVEISLEEFSQAIGGLGFRPCRYELGRGAHLAGSVCEHKTEAVPWTGEWFRPGDGEERAREALAPFEVDGWIGYADDLNNYHRRGKHGSGTYTVHFTRHVDPSTGKPVDRRTRAELLDVLADTTERF